MDFKPIAEAIELKLIPEDFEVREEASGGIEDFERNHQFLEEGSVRAGGILYKLKERLLKRASDGGNEKTHVLFPWQSNIIQINND